MMSVYDVDKGDILKSDCQTLVCPVNVVGVMGKGLAKDMADAYPGLLHAYRRACKRGHLRIDSLWVYPVSEDKQILCFPTKLHWRYPSQLEWIDKNLALLVKEWDKLGIETLAMPKIGCGLGGLDWEKDVLPLIYRHLDGLPVPVYVYT